MYNLDLDIFFRIKSGMLAKTSITSAITFSARQGVVQDLKISVVALFDWEAVGVEKGGIQVGDTGVVDEE